MLEDIAAVAVAARSQPKGGEAASAATPDAAAVNDPIAHLSPSLQLDPAVGIVVIQFRSENGSIELSIPSQQQMQAYQADPLSAFDKDGSTTIA